MDGSHTETETPVKAMHQIHQGDLSRGSILRGKPLQIKDMFFSWVSRQIDILWMDKILHHQTNLGMVMPP